MQPVREVLLQLHSENLKLVRSVLLHIAVYRNIIEGSYVPIWTFGGQRVRGSSAQCKVVGPL